jgi:glycosyltransferase involved in cell wall biosynthesis
VSCIRNGITAVTPAGENVPGLTRKSIGIEEPAFVLGSVGRLTTIKGIEYLLRAVALLINERGLKPMQVAVIGGGPLQKALEELSAELSINEHVRFLGERQDVPNLLRLLDVFVMPSLHEGIPMALLEAMRAGCPIVASAVGGIPEVIRDGKDGMLVPPQDPGALARAIESLYASVQDRMRLSHAGRVRVEAEFGAERMAVLTKEFYKTLLGQQR